MNMYERMNAQAVKVNNGSGVIIGALSTDYSYVLTARHVIDDSPTPRIWNVNGEKIASLSVYHHADPDVDCSLIQIPYVPELALSLKFGGAIPHRSELMMVGYPSTREKESDFHKKVKQHPALFTSGTNGEFVASAEGAPEKDLIDGFSGSGIYHIDGSDAYLIGIEYRMDGARVDEYFGRIKCHDISRYSELIDTYSLAPIMPSFLTCFSSLKPKVFNYDVDDEELIRQLKVDLEVIVDEIIGVELIRPKAILERHKGALLFAKEDASSLLDFRLWVAYLEFIVISVLLDDPEAIDENYLNSLERRRRIVFSKSNVNWIKQLRSLLELAEETLDEGGSLLINNCESAPTAQPQGFQIERMIPNIAAPRRASDKLKINQGPRHRFLTFKLAHIRAIHKLCVNERLGDFFHQKDLSAHIGMLRGFYNAYVD